MKKFILITSIICLSTTAYAALDCKTKAAPTIKKHMEDWDIIATNTGNIDMAPVFSGDDVTYTLSAKPKNKKNIIAINKQTGAITVTAEKKDNFDVTVTAKNSCGKINDKFNIVIDEEE